MSEPMLVEFLHPDETPVMLLDMGFSWLESQKVPMERWERSFRIELSPLLSRGGNTIYELSMPSTPLPDGLDTRLRIQGVVVGFDEERLSQSGNPTRPAREKVYVGADPYNVIVYLTKPDKPYHVKITATRAGRKAKVHAWRIL